MSEGMAATHTCAHPTSNASASLARNCSTAHPSQSSPYGSVHPHLAGHEHASVTASDVEKEGSCPTAYATSPLLASRDRGFRHCSVYQDKDPRWVGPRETSSQQAHGHAPNTSQWSQHRSGANLQHHSPPLTFRNKLGILAQPVEMMIRQAARRVFVSRVSTN